ncbi:MAG TPA: pyridoxal-dependent decarboxylase [Thermoleophilaceae bacterium]|nr:pyridoxal-dependent decarboxylase [Thermoleophilaceae bacterium]
MSPSQHPAPGDLPTSELVEQGRAILDWIAAYLDHPERFPVLPAGLKPGDVRRALPLSPPATGESLDAILRDFETTIVPGITHWNHPGFFAYFAVSGSIPGILGELLIAALNANGMLWKSSPAVTELEALTMDWLRQLLGVPDGWFGIINDTASISSLLAIAAAREAKPELEIRERGMSGRADLPRLRVYTSTEAHSSIAKSALTLGLGLENVVQIGVDDAFRMRPELLERAIAEDRASGYLPLACVATVGTTSTSSIDPVPAIAAICAREAIWLHVDGAYGGSAAVVPELRWVLDGVELADSFVVNPHKWLFTPIDCSALFTRRPQILERAFSLVPEYLVTTQSALVVNLMDYGVQLGRRFRALKLWMVMRAYGSEGLAERIRHHCGLARLFAGWVEAEPGWQVLAPVPFSLVCFRYAPAGVSEAERNTLNERILERVNASGEVFLSHTKLGGRYTVRLAVGNIRTERRHVERAWTLLREAAAAVRAG